MRALIVCTALLLAACAAQTCPPGDKECLQKQEEILQDSARQHESPPLQNKLERVHREVHDVINAKGLK